MTSLYWDAPWLCFWWLAYISFKYQTWFSLRFRIDSIGFSFLSQQELKCSPPSDENLTWRNQFHSHSIGFRQHSNIMLWVKGKLSQYVVAAPCHIFTFFSEMFHWPGDMVDWFLGMCPGCRLNIKTAFPRFGDSHVNDKMVVRPSYL